MQVQKKRKAYDEINVTPMVDLTLVLLIIFILLTTAAVQGIKVNVPKASSSVSLAKPTTKAISIDEKGQVYLDTYAVTMDELETQLRTFKATTEEFPVVVKGDRVTQYGRIMEVLDVCNRVGISQLGLVSERVRPS